MSKVVIPQTVSRPPAESDLFVVRGDKLTFSMGFFGWPEIMHAMSPARLRLVFRLRQDDNLPDILSVEAALDMNSGDTFKGQAADVVAHFEVSPAQTQALPARGCVYFIEWTDATGGGNRRVVQGRVGTGD